MNKIESITTIICAAIACFTICFIVSTMRGCDENMTKMRIDAAKSGIKCEERDRFVPSR